ncbi:DUF4232 domain-containing protein [Streptomyces sp. NPDC002669]|uniref:DUF4232 domain-containing protein n=1 Tax=Streptomyces sp. NPDC002669 TaxID=3364658 RepID=UPI0036821996
MRTLRTRKNTAALGVVTAVLALALTACNGDDGTQSAGTADAGASASASTGSEGTSKTEGASKGTGSEGTSKTGGSAQNTGSSKETGTSGGSAASGGGGNTSDSYAYKHPCKIGDLSIRVYPREGSDTQQVIEVNNTGANSCGLSYFPQVSLGAQNASDHSGDIKPAVPGGLGGAPAYAVKPKTAAIAVLDFNPSGENGVTWVNEMSVLVDGENMSNADTQNFPLPPGAKVDSPKLGLYQSTIAEAVSSMESAG